MEEYDIFAGNESSGFCTYFNDEDIAEFNMSTPGVITTPYYIGALVVSGGKATGYAADASGNKLMLAKFKATRK